MDTSDKKAKIRESFLAGNLRTLSVSPEGVPEWKRVQAAHRARIPADVSNVRVSTQEGSVVTTEDHRVFTSPTTKLEAGLLAPGGYALGSDGALVKVTEVVKAPREPFMYDLTVEGYHNFSAVGPNIIVSNSPDRNYRFAPPEGEGRVGCYNQVFGYIWEDAEFAEYLEIALWKWNIHPPSTEQYNTIEKICQQRPSWQAALLWGALVNAAQALVYNWIHNEFSVAGDTLVTVYLPDGREVTLQIEELYGVVNSGVIPE